MPPTTAVAPQGLLTVVLGVPFEAHRRYLNAALLLLLGEVVLLEVYVAPPQTTSSFSFVFFYCVVLLNRSIDTVHSRPLLRGLILHTISSLETSFCYIQSILEYVFSLQGLLQRWQAILCQSHRGVNILNDPQVIIYQPRQPCNRHPLQHSCYTLKR